MTNVISPIAYFCILALRLAPSCEKFLAAILLILCWSWETPTAALETHGNQDAPLKIVTWGDSITKGVRQGVETDETFAAIVQRRLHSQGISARVLNRGIGGERTDQALERIDSIISEQPRWVTIMYGTNDSYVDPGHKTSRLSVRAYRENLKQMVSQLLVHGIEPILMTEPRWAQEAPPNGLGEHPNLRLALYMEACREVAEECRVPIVDHFADWTLQEDAGQSLHAWTTDNCHPNPRGHLHMASHMLPTLTIALQPRVSPTDYRIQLDTVLKHDDGKSLWFHPRATPFQNSNIPDGKDKQHSPNVLMTLQKHLGASDHYSGLSIMQSHNMGKTWSGPHAPTELDWVRAPDSEDVEVDIAVADVTPGWHPLTSKVIAIGAQVRYSPNGVQLTDQPRSHQTAYAIYDPESKRWAPWRRLDMPEDSLFNFARSACAQFVVEPDGTLLLPFYVGQSNKVPFATTVVRCAFDGKKITYLEHGNVMSLDIARGLYEPSLVTCQERYFLTLRNDLKGYVTTSTDGLHYRPVKPWQFDDGQDLGSYNTQQHWLAHHNSLLLVYTRRGSDNDHIMRHRAPLFIAQVDPSRLQVIRSTEKVLVPERGATLGNFGAAKITEGQSWVTVSEGLWDDQARERGAEGALFVARVIWEESE